MIDKIKNNFISFYWNWKYKRMAALEGYNKISPKCEINGSKIGWGTYIGKYCLLPQVSIGRFCSLANHIKVIRGTHPTNTFVSTHPSFFSTLRQAGFTFTDLQLFEELKFSDSEKKYFVEIGNDVWIGEGVMIMQGIKIGDGAIIGAGSIVTKDIDPYSVCVGIPAKCIKFRFSEEEIDFLLKFKWWNYSIDQLKKCSYIFKDILIFKNSYNKYLYF